MCSYVSMFYVVTYDIPDDLRRNRLAKVLKDFGERVQWSVFECLLDNHLYDRMVQRIAETVEEAEDRVRIYQLCGSCLKVVKIVGLGELTYDPEVYIV